MSCRARMWLRWRMVRWWSSEAYPAECPGVGGSFMMTNPRSSNARISASAASGAIMSAAFAQGLPRVSNLSP